jgi:hypothetical protein
MECLTSATTPVTRRPDACPPRLTSRDAGTSGRPGRSTDCQCGSAHSGAGVSRETSAGRMSRSSALSAASVFEEDVNK